MIGSMHFSNGLVNAIRCDGQFFDGFM